jgi:5-methylcytosine-specific restriction protein A
VHGFGGVAPRGTFPRLCTAPQNKNIDDCYKRNMTNRRDVPDSDKKRVAGRQFYKCANAPEKESIPGYYCPMWIIYGGSFDIAGFDIDHIVEVADGGTNEMENLQALCLSCHRVKTANNSRIRRDKRQKETGDEVAGAVYDEHLTHSHHGHYR